MYPKQIRIGALDVLCQSEESERFLRAREAFVSQYFAKKGWDPLNPSLEQVMEVRQQEGWKNPVLE